MGNLIEEVLISEEVLQARVEELAKEISKDYKGETIHTVSVLKGATIFASDLIRKLEIPVTIDFIGVSSYGKATESSGVVRIIKDLDEPVEDKNVLLIEDIVDTGLTLKYIQELLTSRNPKSLRTCVLLDKKERRKVEVNVEYIGFSIPNKFVVGYGLDFGGKHRNLPFVGVLKEELYL